MADSVEGISDGAVPGLWGAVCLAVLMLIYENLGGMRSVAWTDASNSATCAFDFH
jgi:Na+/proline symporter